MSKSKETFSKKEKEKKKLKKRKEKQEKREERQGNARRSFEDMIAYVDENGNFTSTPPDPALRKGINIEEIQIGIARQVPGEEPEKIREGIVSFFNDSKGYGFIKDKNSKESIFVHANGLRQPIKENDQVTFEVEMGQKGLNAVNVTKV
jgi:cold shock CspA family protein